MNQHFDFTRSKGLEYSLNALNLAGFLFHRGLNLRLSANFIEIFSNSKITATSADADDREMMLSKILDYSTGHLYGKQKDATILLTSSATSSSSSKGNNNGTGNGRSNSAAAVASATVHQMAAISDSVCTNRAVAFVQVVKEGRRQKADECWLVHSTITHSTITHPAHPKFCTNSSGPITNSSLSKCLRYCPLHWPYAWHWP
jgi:hypothetical protein